MRWMVFARVVFGKEVVPSVLHVKFMEKELP